MARLIPPITEVPLPTILDVHEAGTENGYQVLNIHTQRGDVQARYYAAPTATAAVIPVGGVGGGFDSPAGNLYHTLGMTLPATGINVLRVRYRHPTRLTEAVHDTLAGIGYLIRQGITQIGLVGHSFGGAVVIRAGAASPAVTTVVALATQSDRTTAVKRLSPKPLLLIHGSQDQVLPQHCSEQVFEAARQPKELVILDGAGHNLDEDADRVTDLVRSWLTAALAPLAA